jgi:probable rRNA maturation factor
MTDLTLDLRAERDGADVALADGLCGLSEDSARALAAEMLRQAGITGPVALDVLVTDDDVLRQLNHEYRGRDEVTDVLSFPLLESPLAHAPADQLWGAAEEADDERELSAQATRDAALGTFVALHGEDDEPDDASEGDPEGTEFVTPADVPLHLGDIVIARGAVARQAAAAGHSAAWELAFLLAHGVLHLVGYDDHTEAGYAAMLAHQEAALAAIGLSKATYETPIEN